MYIYFLMLFFSLVLAYIFRKNKYLSMIFAFFPFFLISAIRYNVGTDYNYRYVPDYLSIYNGVDVKNLETGFKILIKICIFIAKDNYQIIFVITSFIINYCIFFSIYKNSKNTYLSIILYFLAGFYFQSLNIMRQYLAMSIIIFGYRLVIDKKYVRWIILCIVTSTIHMSSLICISFILLNEIKNINIKLLLISVGMYVVFNKWIQIIVERLILMTRFSSYLNSLYDVSNISITIILKNTILYLFMRYSYMIKEKNNELESLDKLFLNIQGATIIMAILGNVIELFSRMTYYLQIFQILSIPNFILGFKKADNRKIITVLVIIFFGVLFIHSNVLNNHNEVIPYKTIFYTEKIY